MSVVLSVPSSASILVPRHFAILEDTMMRMVAIAVALSAVHESLKRDARAVLHTHCRTPWIDSPDNHLVAPSPSPPPPPRGTSSPQHQTTPPMPWNSQIINDNAVDSVLNLDVKVQKVEFKRHKIDQ